MDLAHPLALATSFAATLARAGAGSRVGPIGKRPALPLVLYEFEGCPFCRRVREALTELDLEAEIRPCPKGGVRFRPDVAARGGKAQFPYLLDPNRDRALYESRDIVRYLYAEYGAGPPPRSLLGPLSAATGSLASLLRGARGSRVHPARASAASLSLWTLEASPAGRLVRERLCELEVPYRFLSVGRGSARRAGVGMEPVLRDAVSTHSWRGVRAILAYLEGTHRRE